MMDADNIVDIYLSGLNEPPKTSHTNVDSLTKTDSEQFYTSHGHSLKVLAILSQGLVGDDVDLLFNPYILRWSFAEKPSNLKPTTAKVRAEIIQCMSIDSSILMAPHPNAWTVTRATEWG